MTTPQERVTAWVRSTLGDEDARNVPERALRAAEEVVELSQACGLTSEALHKLVDYVFAREVGNPKKEIAGCAVTLYAIAEALGANLESEFEIEMVRINRPEVVERVRRRQAEKREVTAADVAQPDPNAVTFSEPVRLPDGSGFFTGSFPLPKNHWLYADHDNEPPALMRTGTADPKRKELERQIVAAARHAVRASTMNGKEMDFDPDAMVQNMIIGLLGYYTEDGLDSVGYESPPAQI